MKNGINSTVILVGSLVLAVVAVIVLAITVEDTSVRWETKFAQQLGLDIEKFEADLGNAEIIAKVDADITDGNTRGVTGTPTIFVNGQRTPSYDFAQLDLLITAALEANPGEVVLVEEFADFQCPACKAALSEISQVKAKYTPEQVNLVYKHFPLENIHKFAKPAAIAAEAAREQGKFDEMHDLLFEYQDTMANPRFR